MKKLLPVLTTILFFIVLEIILTGLNLFLPWDELVHRAGRRFNQFILNQEFENRAQYLRDPDLYWKIKPGWGKGGHHVNKLGFRGPEFDPIKPDGVFRIVCLGNSCTFAWDVEDISETYPSRLGSKFKKNFPHKCIEVINGGVDGYSSFQILQYWRKIISKFNPDIITIYASFNDIVYTPYHADKEIRLPKITCTMSNFLFNLRIVRACNALVNLLLKKLGRKEYVTPYNEDTGLLTRVSPSDYRDNLSTLVKEARADNTGIVFVTSPIRGYYPLGLIPLPEIYNEDGQSSVRWFRQEEVNHTWSNRVTLSGTYDRELQASLSEIRKHPGSPCPYFKAAFCYQSLGDSVSERRYFQKSDSLSVTRDALEEYNGIMREVAEEYGVPLVDCEVAFGNGDNAYLFIGDGIHPNAEGHALLAEEIFKVVENFVIKIR